MYTIEWARSFNGFSKDKPINLKEFTSFYDQHIAERYFTYTTTSKQMPDFTIETRRNQLPHLMALHKWNNIDVRQPEKQYEKLISGEWDIDFLKSIDKGSFKEHISRIEFVGNLYNLLYHFDCSIRLIGNTNPPSVFNRRQIDMVFQKNDSKLVYFLELRENKENTFVPVTITYYPINSNKLRFKSLPLKVTDVLIEIDS